MKLFVKLFLGSIIIRAFDLVREVKASFPEEVLIELKSEIDTGKVRPQIAGKEGR